MARHWDLFMFAFRVAPSGREKETHKMCGLDEDFTVTLQVKMELTA
jgi:hypothetical protein